MARDIEALADGLRAWLPRGGTITGVKTISAGHSNETYLVEGLNEILRLPPSEEGLLPPYDMARQHSILNAVKAHCPDLPLPGMLELCTDPSVLGDPFFLMECVKGDAFEYAVPDWVNADPVGVSDSICRQWFKAMTALHRMPAEHMPTETRTVAQEAQHWLTVAEGANASAQLIEILQDIVKRPMRTSGAPTPVHGDIKHGNLLWHEGQLTAVLDWEMAGIGEPMMDLGYVLFFHDQGEAGLANAGFDLPGWWRPERMIAAWEEGTGRSAVDVGRYTVLGQAKIAAIISLGAHLFDTGRVLDPRFKGFGMVLPAFERLLFDRAMAVA